MHRAFVLLLLLAGSAAAHPESAAAELRPDVVGVGHAPEHPAPGTQWQGHVQFAPGHNVTDVRYQICRVGEFCFAPPTLTTQQGDRFVFETQHYVDAVSGSPVAWGVGDGSDWLVGYKFLLTHEDGSQAWLPQGIPHEDCEMSFIECDATHYFVFTIEGIEAHRAAPSPAMLLPLLIAFLLRRHA